VSDSSLVALRLKQELDIDELETIYLWGMQVYGKQPSRFMGVTAGFG
jgi:hypothetical protein